MLKREQIKRIKDLSVKHGWERYYIQFCNGIKTYMVCKNGFTFLIKDKREMDKFCDVLRQDISDSFGNALVKNFPNYSYEYVLRKY